MNDGERFRTETFEGVYVVASNLVSHIAFVLESVLNAHWNVNPVLWLGVNQISETEEDIQGFQSFDAESFVF